MEDASKNDPEKILKELEQLDDRLARLQRFFQCNKSGNVEDSLLTSENIQEAIRLLETINPTEKNMIQALKMLLPLSQKSDTEIKMEQTKQKSKTCTRLTSHVGIHNQWTSKIKGRTSPNRMI